MFFLINTYRHAILLNTGGRMSQRHSCWHNIMNAKHFYLILNAISAKKSEINFSITLKNCIFALQK